MKIVLFNGPPGSGKDTLANGLVKDSIQRGGVAKFAAPLKAGVPAFYGISQERFDFWDSCQEEKKKPRDELLGLSCRQAQINLSEVYGKPVHGDSFFGEIMLAKLQGAVNTDYVAISDSGFRPEAEVQVEIFGPTEIFLVRIHRDGTNFDEDSRDYIHLSDLGVAELDLDNNRTVEEAVLDVMKFTEID